MSGLQERLKRSGGNLEEVFRILIPGNSLPVQRLRADAIALCQDPGARGALILGPAGSGKSTLARAISLGRYLHLLTPDRAVEVIGNVRVDPPARIAKFSMNWYEELSLTGLVTELADSQLFGILRGTATDVTERQGVFQQAMTGHGPPQSDAALITGGVVFLDEIGDLPPPLQPKLLTVLTGAEVAPVGGEAKQDTHFRFQGLTIAATWKDPIAEALLRRDLLSRLADHVLQIPSLTQRLADLDVLVPTIVAEIRSGYEEWLKQRESVKRKGFDLERATGRLGELADYELNPEELDVIRKVDWSEYGDLRGLSQVLRRAIERDVSVADSLERQLRIPVLSTDPPLDGPEGLYQRLLELEPDGRGLPGLVQSVERESRTEFVREMRVSSDRLARLATHLGMTEAELRSRLADVARDRRVR